MFDKHKAFTESQQKWLADHATLLQMSSQVDYDQEGYAEHLMRIISEQEDALRELKGRVGAFRTQLSEEEMMSKKIVKRKK